MLELIIPGGEFFDEENQMFVQKESQELKLEHSLISLSRWESKWHKPFIGNDTKTMEETIDYIKCMTLNKNVDPDVYNHLTGDNIRMINDYIKDPMTATTFNEQNQSPKSREIITAEILYYDMIAFNIPVEFQKWHLNRLITLIRVCSIKQNPPKKMSKGDIMRRNAELNAARRKQLNSKG